MILQSDQGHDVYDNVLSLNEIIIMQSLDDLTWIFSKQNASVKVFAISRNTSIIPFKSRSKQNISQPANFAHLLILPFFVFPLYAHTRMVKGRFLMLCQQSGTLSLTKSGHPMPSQFFKSSLKTYLFQQSYWLCVCVCERERERERGRGGGRERERTSGEIFF